MWEQFFVSVGLVVLGFGLGRLPPWLDRRRRVRSHWQALRGELLLSTERVNTFLDDNVKAPLYRLPTRAFDAALKALLSEGLEISPDEMKILYESADLIAPRQKPYESRQAAKRHLAGRNSDRGREAELD